jgi:hypothetical protein
MDSSPSWLLAKRIISLKFAPVGQDMCANFRIESVKLFQRKAVFKE